MKIKEKSKRNFWQDSEIECMLNLIKEVQNIQGTTATTHNTFVLIANRMKKYGFSNKSPTQIRRKWFQMKSAFLCYKRGNSVRLLLIPEKFRNVIGQFVQSDLKNSKLGVTDDHEPKKGYAFFENVPDSHPLKENSSENKSTKTCSTRGINKSHGERIKIEKIINRIRINQGRLNEEIFSMQQTLLMYEQQYQTVRDSNLISFMNSVKEVLEQL